MTTEHAVIGCVMADNLALLYAMQRLEPDDFYDPGIGALYGEIIAKYQQNGAFGQDDALLLHDKELASVCLHTAADFGGLDGAVKWIDAVKDAAIARKVASLALNMAAPGQSIDALLEKNAEITTLLQGEGGDGIEDITQTIGKWLLYLGKKQDTQFMTGIGECDKLLKMEPGMFIVIGGRPSAGKTALALQMMVNMAKHGKRCIFFSLETSPELLLERIVANYATIPLSDYVKKTRDGNDTETAMACDEISKLPMWLISASGRSIQWMASVAAQKQADAIFVDYLQLIPQKGDGRYEQVTKTSMELHTLAQQSGRLVVALAQLNRDIAGKPTLRNLRDSGQIEQDADGIILLNKTDDDYYFELAKNKRGLVGSVNVVFNGETQSFYEVMDA